MARRGKGGHSGTTFGLSVAVIYTIRWWVSVVGTVTISDALKAEHDLALSVAYGALLTDASSMLTVPAE